MESCQKYPHVRRKKQAPFYSPTDGWIMSAASTIKSEENSLRKILEASMHIVRKRDLNSAEMEIMRIPKNPTTVMTANCEVSRNEDVTKHVKELELFVRVVAS